MRARLRKFGKFWKVNPPAAIASSARYDQGDVAVGQNRTQDIRFDERQSDQDEWSEFDSPLDNRSPYRQISGFDDN
jgi:hypothetical protein